MNHDAAALIVFGALEPIIRQVDARVVVAVGVCAVSVCVCVRVCVKARVDRHTRSSREE